MIKITDTMVLALLKKDMIYEFEECDMDMEIEMPLNFLGEEDISLKMKIKGQVKGFKIEITQD